MASMKIEVVASSSPFHYTSLRDHNRSANIKGYIHSQCIRKNKAEGGDQDDDSWLPTSSQNSAVTSDAEGSNHRKGQDDVDDSWLPTVNDTNGKYRTLTNESENDIDYSWLPSTFIDNNKNKHKHKNDTNIKNKSTSTNANKNKNYSKSNSNSKSNNSPRSRNDHWALAREVVFSCDQQNRDSEVKTLESSRLQQEHPPRYVVESPTSGGVSSLLQRWKDLAEAKNSNKNGNSSPSSNRTNLGSTCKEKKSNNSSNSPPSPSNESDGNWESDKACRRLSCPLPSRDANDSNPGGAEKEKIRVVDIIKKLSREEELAASHGGNGNGNGNALLPPIRTNLNHKQIEGEQNGFKGVKVSRHLIRGRQAFNNFLMQMEHDKHHELKWLVERKAVSKFSHRGRIQVLSYNMHLFPSFILECVVCP